MEKTYHAKRAKYGAEIFAQVEKFVLLNTLDSLWKEHLLQMDHLKEGIGLRGYAQKDPLVEYKREGFTLFTEMMRLFAEAVVSKIMLVEIKTSEVAESVRLENTPSSKVTMAHGEVNAFSSSDSTAAKSTRGMSADGRSTGGSPSGAPPVRQRTVRNVGPKLGRNDPCSCGSGKKFKKCCGA